MPTMLDPQKVAALQDRDLATIREEIASSCPYLGHALGFPVELLVVDANDAVFLAENSLVSASWSMDNDQITFDDIEIYEGVEDPTKTEKARELVEAIVNNDMAEADRVWPAFESKFIADFISRQRLSQMAESVSFDKASAACVRSVELPVIEASRLYFRSENFDELEKLPKIREQLAELKANSIDSEEAVSEKTFYTARGGKKAPKRVRVDRKKARIAKRYARKNRSALINRLKKARRKLKKLFRKPTFRNKMKRVRRMNEARDKDQLSQLLRDTISETPNIAYLTIPELTYQIEEALKMEGVNENVRDFAEEAAHSLTLLARHFYPESTRYITEAAMAFLPASYDIPSEDHAECVEHVNRILWEKADEQDSTKSAVVKAVHDLVSSLVDTLTDDLDNASDDDDSKEISDVLDKLKEYRNTLAGFSEDPESADLGRVEDVLDYVAGIMDVEDEDEDEDESDNGSDDDDSDPSGGMPEDDEEDDEEGMEESTAPGQMVGDEHDSDFYGDGHGRNAKKPGRLPGSVKTKNEACATHKMEMEDEEGEAEEIEADADTSDSETPSSDLFNALKDLVDSDAFSDAEETSVIKRARKMASSDKTPSDASVAKLLRSLIDEAPEQDNTAVEKAQAALAAFEDDGDDDEESDEESDSKSTKEPTEDPEPMIEAKTPSTAKAKQTHEQDQDPEFYGAGGKANAKAQKKDASQAPYDENLAHQLFGGSPPKTEAHGEQSDHSVSSSLDRNPLFEGFGMTQMAGNALKELMKELGNPEDNRSSELRSNEWKRGRKTYFYEIDREDQPDGGIKGDVTQGEPSVKEMGQFHIDGNGYIVKFPGASKTAISKVNKTKERRAPVEMNEASKNLSVPEQHQKRVALKTLRLPGTFDKILGGMSKEDARKFLKDKCGYTDKRIASLEESVFFEEQGEDVYVPEKARDAVKRWADQVGAVVSFSPDGKAKIPSRHMQAFKTNFKG